MNNFHDLQNLRGLGDWDGHYDDPLGYAKVEARRAVYDLTEAGVRAIDWDQEVIKLIGAVGFSREVDFADIGCSYPHLLQKMITSGYSGRNGEPLYGVEPNTRQFGGLGYWEPIESRVSNTRLENLRLKMGEQLDGIRLVQATAQELPFHDEQLDLISFMFSAYHIPENKQVKAFDEAKRVLKKNGILFLATSGNDNKEGMRENESNIADCVSEIMKQAVFAPKPLNAGFTSEKATEVLTNNFNNVSCLHHEFRIVINSIPRLNVMLNAYRSLIDMYTDKQGNMGIVPLNIFNSALKKVVVSQVVNASNRCDFVTDRGVQDLFVASDGGLAIPLSDYSSLKAT